MPQSTGHYESVPRIRWSVPPWSWRDDDLEITDTGGDSGDADLKQYGRE